MSGYHRERQYHRLTRRALLRGEPVMSNKLSRLVLSGALLWMLSPVSQATGNQQCQGNPLPAISFVEFLSLDLAKKPPIPLMVKAKLKLPVGLDWKQRCFTPKRNLPAVVILHGSAGVDSRGEFYAQALNAVGIATFEIDMWEARGVTGIGNRPQLPILTHPDAFAALKFLSGHDNIDPNRIGVLGFSWGGVMSLASAEELYANQFGGGLKFAAHVAHYPVCYGANNPAILPGSLTPAAAGTQFLKLTGAPVLIQIGTEDDYDNGAGACLSLKDDLIDPNQKRLIEVAVYEGAYHAWDRLQVPVTALDPFANEGSFFSTGVLPEIEIVPDVDQAYASLKRAIKFFLDHL